MRRRSFITLAGGALATSVSRSIRADPITNRDEIMLPEDPASTNRRFENDRHRGRKSRLDQKGRQRPYSSSAVARRTRRGSILFRVVRGFSLPSMDRVLLLLSIRFDQLR